MRVHRFRTAAHCAHELSDELREAARQSGVDAGILVASIPHTTAGLAILSWPDPLGLEDVMDELRRLVPHAHRFQAPARYAAGRRRPYPIGAGRRLAQPHHRGRRIAAGPLAGRLLPGIRWPARPATVHPGRARSAIGLFPAPICRRSSGSPCLARRKVFHPSGFPISLARLPTAAIQIEATQEDSDD